MGESDSIDKVSTKPSLLVKSSNYKSLAAKSFEFCTEGCSREVYIGKPLVVP